jgi:hypothetical protein
MTNTKINTKVLEAKRQLARDRYCTSDDIEIDDDALISVGDTGFWVQAWVYVPTEEGDV